MSQFQSPFFMNLYFYLPSAENTSKNVSHISYIGTRPGVVFEEGRRKNLETAFEEDPESFGSDQIEDASPDMELPRGRSSAWLSSYADRIEDSDSREANLDSPAAHVKYAHERPRSHGLFSSDKIDSVKSIQDELRSHKGIVWRTILSLNEADAIRLGYHRRDAWESMLKANVPLMAHEMGIPESNLRWVAAFHEEEGHPHVHLVLWEKEPKRKLGQLLNSERIAVRKTFVNEIYGQERVRLAQEKTAQRDILRDIAKEDLIKAVELSRELRIEESKVEMDIKAAGTPSSVGIHPKLFTETSKELAARLDELALVMPRKGRIAYKYMPDDVKGKVDEITDWVLRQPAQKEVLDKYLKAVDGMTRPYSFQEAQIEDAKAKAYEDIRKRVGQVVLKAASESQKDNFSEIIPEKAETVVKALSGAMSAPADPYMNVIQESIQQLRLLGFSKEEQIELFQSWQDKSELHVTPIELIQLIENDQIKQLDFNQFKPHAAAMILNFTGKPLENIKERLLKVEMHPDDIEEILELIDKDVQQSQIPFLNENDWARFIRNVGLSETGSPWIVKESSQILEEKKLAFLESLKHAVFSENLSTNERNWTAFCMTVALKHMGLDLEERQNIMQEFASRNAVNGLNRILEHVENEDTNFLRKPTWEKVMSNLNTPNNEYPWVTREEIVFDSSRLEEILEETNSAHPPEMSPKEAQWTAEKLMDLLKSIRPPAEVNTFLKEWAAKVGLEEIPKAETKRQDDLDLLTKSLGIKDMQQIIVTNFAKVLFAAGLAKERVSKIIKDWNERSNARISEKKLDKIIHSAEKHCSDLKAWGRVPYVNKKQFQQLIKTLGVEAPWMWKGTRSFQKYERDASNNMAQGVWKAIWRGLEQERQKSEAKGEIIRRQLVREQVRRAQQSEEQER